jgi:malate dehydrogenase (oxaloacetate-decarboxylating)
MDYAKMALDLHRKNRGKIAMATKVPLANRDDLSTAYTPGVAEPCREIHKDPEAAYTYTAKGNMVAVVTDGSAVLGLGNIGGLAALPVMEGKCAIFKAFADVDAVPICLDTQDTKEIIKITEALSLSFGGINLEDIGAPRCFEIEEQLQKRLNIPVFHDDQHGTAVVVTAALINALRVVAKELSEVKVVVCGVGAAGTAIIKMLIETGVRPSHITPVDKDGIMQATDEFLDPVRKRLVAQTNNTNRSGTLAEAMVGADVFIGVSAPGVLTEDMVRSMNEDAIVFANANPTPEIMPDVAKRAGARIVGTGRSDFPNQINNSLAFPGIFRGALDARATRITPAMKVAAAYALAGRVKPEDLHEDNIITSMFDPGNSEAIAQAVAEAWLKQNG